MAKILAIDDEAEVLAVLRSVFDHSQDEFTGETRGDMALLRFRQSRPDLVLLDLNLRDRPGLDICADIRAESAVPIIILSAHTNEDEIRGSYERGADDYIVKPFRPEELRAKVAAHLLRSDIGREAAGDPGRRLTIPPGGLPFGKYRLLQEIGAGGTGRVYRACPETDRSHSVAIKILSPALARNRRYLEMFIREAGTARAVDDPHLVRVLDIGHYHAVHYYVMAYVPGVSLFDTVERNGCMRTIPGLRIIRDILHALAAVHEAGLFHGDVSSRNVLLPEDGPARLVDFCMPLPPLDGYCTTSTWVFGTPHFIAPERVQGHEPDIRSDLYSLGMVAFYALVGTTPFRGNVTQVMYHQVHTQVKIPDSIPDAVARFIHHLTEKSPEGRPANPGAALVEVSSLLDMLGSDSSSPNP